MPPSQSINVLSSKNHDAKGVKNPYENRERTQCSMNTRSFIFFTRILAQSQISSLISEGFFVYFSSLVPDLEMWYTNYENCLNF